MNKNDSRIQLLLDHLDSVFAGNAWHGAALLPTVRTIDLEHALMKNSEGYSPWMIVLHCAYWKFVVRKALTLSAEKPVFPRTPDDFPSLPGRTDEASWKADIRFLEDEHALLRRAVEQLPAERYDEVPQKETFSYAGLVLGAAAHDVYHTAHIRNLGVQRF